MSLTKIVVLLAVGIFAGMSITRKPVTMSELPAKSPRSVSLGMYRVSAYCLCDRCINVPAFRDGKTASGKPAEGLIVAAPPSIPFGVRLAIPGYSTALNPAVVEDRGGAIKGKRLDLLFGTHQEALSWGIKHLEIHQVN